MHVHTVMFDNTSTSMCIYIYQLMCVAVFVLHVHVSWMIALKITCLSASLNISFLLQGIVDSSAQKLVTLANQWEKHRVPLIEQYRELKELNSKKEVSVLKTWMTKGSILVDLGCSTLILKDVNCNAVSVIFIVRGREEIRRN